MDPPNRPSISQSCLSAVGEEATISIINRQGQFAANQNRRPTCSSACLSSGFSSSAEDSQGRPGARLSICPQESRLQTTSYETRLHLTIRAKNILAAGRQLDQNSSLSIPAKSKTARLPSPGQAKRRQLRRTKFIPKTSPNRYSFCCDNVGVIKELASREKLLRNRNLCDPQNSREILRQNP